MTSINASGVVGLPVADFTHGAIFKAEYARVELEPDQVRSGGTFAMLNMGNLNMGKPVLLLHLERPAL